MPYSLRRSAEKLCERSGSEKTRAIEKTKARRDGKAARAERAKKRSALREAKKARRKALCAERRTGLEDLLKKARKRATAHGKSEFGKRRFASPLFSRCFAFPTDICPFPLAFCCMSRDSFPTKAETRFRQRKTVFCAGGVSPPQTPRERLYGGELSGTTERCGKGGTSRLRANFQASRSFRG